MPCIVPFLCRFPPKLKFFLSQHIASRAKLFYNQRKPFHYNEVQQVIDMDIFTTMITPYKADGSVDYETAEKWVDWYYAKGLTGIFAVCQSSEIFFLTLEERVELNRRVYARAKA